MKRKYLSLLLFITINFISLSQTLSVNLIDGSNVPTTYDVVYAVENFNIPSDGYLELSINGQTPIILNTENSGNVTIESIVGTDTISLELLDPMGNSLVPQFIYTATVNVLPTTDVATLGELRTGTIGDFYKFTGVAFLTFQQNLRNQKYLQDEDNNGEIHAIKIDDPRGSIINTVTEFEGISGIVGQLTEYHGILQFQPYSSNIVITPPASFSTADSTLDNLLTNWETYESEMVNIGLPTDSFSFAGSIPGDLFVANTNYTITDGTTNLTFRTLFQDADYIGTQIPTTFNALTAIVSEYDGVPQVSARKLTDFIGATLSTEGFNTNDFVIYPNPVSSDFITIKGRTGNNLYIEVYDLVGKIVLKTSLENNKLNISSLNSGTYIAKIIQENNLVTKKIIIE